MASNTLQTKSHVQPDFNAPFAVIADMDGLILDSEYQRRRAYQATVRELFGVETNVRDYEHLLGASMQETITELSKMFGEHPVIDPTARFNGRPLGHMIIEERKSRHDKAVDGPHWLMPGVTAALDVLDQLKIPRAIGTSAGETVAKEMLEAATIARRFDAIVGLGSPGVKEPKPAPDILIAAAQELRAPLKQCYMLGDSLSDMGAARAAGTHGVYVVDRRVADPNPKAVALAHHVAESLPQATEYLMDRARRG